MIFIILLRSNDLRIFCFSIVCPAKSVLTYFLLFLALDKLIAVVIAWSKCEMRNLRGDIQRRGSGFEGMVLKKTIDEVIRPHFFFFVFAFHIAIILYPMFH